MTIEAPTTASLNAEIPVDLHERVRIRAVRERRPLKAVVRDALERYLESVGEGSAA